MVTVSDVRRFVAALPRSYEALVGGRIKFRVGRIVYLSFSRDESVMGFAFPKEERDWLIGGSPEKFMQPEKSDLRYNWVLVRLASIDEREMRELVLDAWRMVVPKSVAERLDANVVDPDIHNSNTFEFGGQRLRLGLNGSGASDQALEAVRRFVAERGILPTAASWTHACMSPSEKTIRRRFGSFKAAVQCAGIDFVEPARPA